MAGSVGYIPSTKIKAAQSVQERIQKHDSRVIERIWELRYEGRSYWRIAELLTLGGMPGPGVGYQFAGK